MRNFANRVEDVSGGGERNEFLPLGSACEKLELRPDEELTRVSRLSPDHGLSSRSVASSPITFLANRYPSAVL